MILLLLTKTNFMQIDELGIGFHYFWMVCQRRDIFKYYRPPPKNTGFIFTYCPYISSFFLIKFAITSASDQNYAIESVYANSPAH